MLQPLSDELLCKNPFFTAEEKGEKCGPLTVNISPATLSAGWVVRRELPEASVPAHSRAVNSACPVWESEPTEDAPVADGMSLTTLWTVSAKPD